MCTFSFQLLAFVGPFILLLMEKNENPTPLQRILCSFLLQLKFCYNPSRALTVPAELNTIWKDKFAYRKQHDAEEFLIFLLNNLSEGLFLNFLLENLADILVILTLFL